MLIPLILSKARGNSTSKTAVVIVPSATTKTLSYDNNGNLTNDGERTYEWDAQNRLVAINYTGNTKRSEFSYDGMNRRVRIVEKTGNTTTSDIRHLYDGPEIAEERDSIVATVQKQYFAQGFKAGMAKYYYAKDHLGSIVELVDDSGVVRGQWTYDLWGKRSANQITTNPVNSDFGFTNHFQHDESGLIATMYRFYDPVTARWLSQDWIGEAGGMNLYGYVTNNPVNFIDPLGLDCVFLNDSAAVYRQGHAAILVGDNKTGWSYYAKDGYGPGRYGDGNNRLAVYPTFSDFSKSPDAARFDRGVYVPTTPDQDSAMTAYGDANYRSPYNGRKNNCGNLVNDILNAGGIKGAGNTFGTVRPNSQYDDFSRRPGWAPFSMK